VCKNLARFLAESDSEATEFLGRERLTMLEVFGAEDFPAFERAVEDYDFDRALALLKKHAWARGISCSS
jgi:hypothetical protein